MRRLKNIISSIDYAVVLQVMLIGVTNFIFLSLLGKPDRKVTLWVLGLTLIVQLILLIRHVNRMKRDLIQFLEVIKNQDTSALFKTGSNRYYTSVYEGFNKIISEFRLIRIEKATEQQFFNYVIENVSVGVIAFDISGDILLYNEAFRRQFSLDKKIDKLMGLNSIHDNLAEILLSLNGSKMLNVRNNVYALKCSHFVVGGKKIRLVTILDIRNEMDAKEVQTWHRMVRVLSHEIMNSVTPINLITSGLIKEFSYAGNLRSIDEIDQNSIDELLEKIRVVQNRGKGLVRIVEGYKNLAVAPRLNVSKFPVADLIDGVEALFLEEFHHKNIHLEKLVNPSDLELRADRRLIEQVLINLVKNSIQALYESPTPAIIVKSFQNEGRVIIEVHDNGVGIKPEVIENIFFPFYTTQPEGSGIGLSVCRQIMTQHGGTIAVESEVGEGAKFELVFA